MSNTVKADFGVGGANLTPDKSSGQPSLAEVLRGVADDLALIGGAGRYTEETVPVDTNVGLLYADAELIEFVDNAGANVAQVASGVAPGAGEFKIAADRRTVTFGDAIASAVVAYRKAIELSAINESLVETYALTDGWTLLVSVDGGAVQTATFETADFIGIGVATAAEIVIVLNADIADQVSENRGGKVVMRANSVGTESSIEVTGGTAAAALGFTAGEQVGTGVSTLKA